MRIVKFTIIFILTLFLSACIVTDESEQPVSKERMIRAGKINIELGMAYLDRGDVDRAKQKFLLALDQAPSLPEAWYSMAYFQESVHNFHLANYYYRKAIVLAPKAGAVHNNYGTFLCNRKNYKGAIAQFVLATKDPVYLSSGAAYENAGLCAMDIPDISLAKYFFEKALIQDPRREVAKQKLAAIDNTL